jgi:hypothetical protein
MQSVLILTTHVLFILHFVYVNLNRVVNYFIFLPMVSLIELVEGSIIQCN